MAFIANIFLFSVGEIDSKELLLEPERKGGI